MSKTLEQEFEEFKAIHKFAILKAKMIDYYNTLEDGELNIPSFLRKDTPEKKADKDIRELLCLGDGGAKFNSLYEMAWDSMAEILP